jgi:hypothetical protein
MPELAVTAEPARESGIYGGFLMQAPRSMTSERPQLRLAGRVARVSGGARPWPSNWVNGLGTGPWWVR